MSIPSHINSIVAKKRNRPDLDEQSQKKPIHWWKNCATSLISRDHPLLLILMIVTLIIAVRVAQVQLYSQQECGEPYTVCMYNYYSTPCEYLTYESLLQDFPPTEIPPIPEDTMKQLMCTFEKGQFPYPTIIRDPSELRHAVAEIGNWLGLCENLKINTGTIEELKYSNDHAEYRISECLTRYFDKGEAVWEEVVFAVAQPRLSKGRLAKKIARTYLHEPNQAKILKMLRTCNY